MSRAAIVTWRRSAAASSGAPRDGAEIEEDIGEHDLLVTPRAHPAGHLRVPLRQRLAPKRVRRHDVPRAQGKACVLEPAREPLRQLDEKPIDAFVR